MRGSQKFPEFFDIDDVMHREFIPPGQIITGHFYLQISQRLCDAVRRKWQEQWFLHHDNAPCHTLLVVKQFLTEKNIPFIIQTSYSLNLTSSDFWLFPTLKMGLKGTCFATMEDIKSSATAELWKIPKEALHWCFQQGQDQWNKCVCVCANVCVKNYLLVVQTSSGAHPIHIQLIMMIFLLD
jgi:hypothetical protein